MAIRAFAGIQSIAVTGTGQPVFGTTLSAAVTPPPDPFSNNLNPGSNETQVEIAVGSTTGFRVGDQVAIGPASAFAIGGATSLADVGTIKQIMDGTHLLVQGLVKSHALGEYCVLDEIVGNVHIVPVSGTANDALYIGSAPTVALADASVFDVIWIAATAGTAPPYAHDSESIGGSQPLTTSSYWIAGTAADKFCARFTQV